VSDKAIMILITFAIVVAALIANAQLEAVKSFDINVTKMNANCDGIDIRNFKGVEECANELGVR